jgi:ABC-type tungstate transport system permease subunit
MIRFVLAMCLLAKVASAETIILASTTSVENSGLLARILPEFTAGSAIAVRVIALGTGQPWYREIGGGMGAALNMAAATDALTLADRGTWLAFGNRRDMIELVAGDPALINRYDVIELNPQTYPTVKLEPARHRARWLVSTVGQLVIGRYMMGGEQLFHPSAR